MAGLRAAPWGVTLRRDALQYRLLAFLAGLALAPVIFCNGAKGIRA